MQNLRKLFVLTITFICANYFSTLAQDEQKAFKEGDKVLTFGLSGAGSGVRGFNSALRPTITFDYGLKGTNGIVSIGGFASYFASNSIYNPSGIYSSGISGDSIYGLAKGDGNRAVYQRLAYGMRFALHYSTHKWDLYGGVIVGYEHTATKSNDYSLALYKILPNSTSIPFGTEEVKGVKYNSGQFLFSPYVGARYYITKKVSLNLEIGQHTGNAGIGFKF